MFISEKAVYLELHKTGCTHIRNVLKDLLGGKFVGKHNQAMPDLFRSQRLFLGSIRDPWDWYVSLWAYGCDNKGAVFSSVTKSGIVIKGLGWKNRPYSALLGLVSEFSKDIRTWKRLYRDSHDAGAFRDWLHMMHDRRYRYDVGENYGACPLSKIAGLLTYRYIRLYCAKAGELSDLNHLSAYETLASYEKKKCFINRFIRKESLESDLIDALEQYGIGISDAQKAELASRPRTNVSSLKERRDYYYDNASEDLVNERDRLIVEKFGYIAPSLHRQQANTASAGNAAENMSRSRRGVSEAAGNRNRPRQH